MTFDLHIRRGGLLDPVYVKFVCSNSRSQEENVPFSGESESEIGKPVPVTWKKSRPEYVVNCK